MSNENMETSSIALEQADSDSIERVETLLETNGLPYEDVHGKAENFFLAYEDSMCVGIGGVEVYESSGLLRSVVVPESNRGQGHGAALCEALENYARNNEVSTLYLLTTTATAFFSQMGYEEIPRDVVPPQILQTTEFSEYCPDSATCMRKRI